MNARFFRPGMDQGRRIVTGLPYGAESLMGMESIATQKAYWNMRPGSQLLEVPMN